MRCQQCHATLKRGFRIDDDDIGHGQEYRCDGCGAVGCVLDSGRRIGEAVNGDATSRPRAVGTQADLIGPLPEVRSRAD